MGLLKLAIIGGAAYYAGKKFNEGPQGPANMQQHGGCHGWKRNRHWHEQPQPEPSNPQDPGMKRDLHNQASPADMYNYYHNTEKPTMIPGYGYASPPQDFKQAQVTGTETTTMPPVYAGYGRPLSPQQRLYPQQQGQEQLQLRRAESPEGQAQQQQQLEFGEPKASYAGSQRWWK